MTEQIGHAVADIVQGLDDPDGGRGDDPIEIEVAGAHLPADGLRRLPAAAVERPVEIAGDRIIPA